MPSPDLDSLDLSDDADLRTFRDGGAPFRALRQAGRPRGRPRRGPPAIQGRRPGQGRGPGGSGQRRGRERRARGHLRAREGVPAAPFERLSPASGRGRSGPGLSPVRECRRRRWDRGQDPHQPPPSPVHRAPGCLPAPLDRERPAAPPHLERHHLPPRPLRLGGREGPQVRPLLRGGRRGGRHLRRVQHGAPGEPDGVRTGVRGEGHQRRNRRDAEGSRGEGGGTGWTAAWAAVASAG